jgi:arylformamidase
MPLRSDMAHWPGDPDVEIERYESIARGCEYNATRISMSAHTGTHIDAPLHYLTDGAGIDTMPLEIMTGPARVIASTEIESTKISRGERILAKTGGSLLDPVLARYLANSAIALAGIDSLSIGGTGELCAEIHKILLGAGVWIVEGLVLDHVEPGTYEFLCLPLKLMGADGAPARALLRRL